MEEMLELALKRIADIEKKLERYYQLLLTRNELDFILKGSYVLDSDIQNLLEGKEKQ